MLHLRCKGGSWVICCKVFGGCTLIRLWGGFQATPLLGSTVFKQGLRVRAIVPAAARRGAGTSADKCLRSLLVARREVWWGAFGHKHNGESQSAFFQICLDNCWIFTQSNSFSNSKPLRAQLFSKMRSCPTPDCSWISLGLLQIHPREHKANTIVTTKANGHQTDPPYPSLLLSF